MRFYFLMCAMHKVRQKLHDLPRYLLAYTIRLA